MSAVGPTVLIVDDDDAVATVLSLLLEQAGISTLAAADGQAALGLLQRHPVDVVVSDVRMPGMDGLSLLRRVVAQFAGLPVILLTAHGTVPLAVEAMRAGAHDFIVKPFDRDEVLFVIQKALALASADSEQPHSEDSKLLGGSRALHAVHELVRRAATSAATVLIRGETGTGKELVARAVHVQSPRREQAFVRLHCAALPDSLLESELFGYEKGAFTGATTRKPGRVELANGGTLFLDEIGDIPPTTQVKLLRLLQEREIERLGGTKTIPVDVRFVAATHRNLEEMVAREEFREDLFYRLNVIPIELPPLRERREDISLLARHFARAAGAANGRSGAVVDSAALELLENETWPGNVRQLENFVERLVVLSDSIEIGRADVERELERDRSRRPSGESRGGGVGLEARRKDAEREAVVDALKRADDNRSLAARLLGINRRTLYNKMQELGIA